MAAIDATTSSYDRLEEVKKFDESKMGVKGLSDSGITSIPEFFIHSPQILADFRNARTSDDQISIPIIDLSNTNRTQLVNQVKEAASTWGFFQVINHGVSRSVLDSTTEAIKSFHEQPYEARSKFYRRQEKNGFSYVSNNDLYRTKAAYWNDHFQVWVGPNGVDGEEIPEICRKELVEWDVHAKNVAEAVMEHLSEGLGLEAGKFKELTFSEKRVLVGICYPYCPQPDLTIGFVDHTDSPILTVLLTNEVEGLQVKHDEYGWVAVKPVPGGLIINVGDLLQIISNGQYKSVQHRVVANSSKKSRISVVEFFNIGKWKGNGYYGPLPELLSAENRAIYRDLTEQEFIENIYSKGFDSKSLVEKVKI